MTKDDITVRGFLPDGDSITKLSRFWSMSNSRTFLIPPIREFVERHITGSKVVVDPFANESRYGTITNDLNPAFDTEYKTS